MDKSNVGYAQNYYTTHKNYYTPWYRKIPFFNRSNVSYYETNTEKFLKSPNSSAGNNNNNNNSSKVLLVLQYHHLHQQITVVHYLQNIMYHNIIQHQIIIMMIHLSQHHLNSKHVKQYNQLQQQKKIKQIIN
eukprot:UN01608